MADNDRRDHRSGGGGGYRKRRYRDDDDQYDRRNQRRRYDPPPPARMRRQLLSLADSPLRRWAEEVQNLADLVAENYDDEETRRSFIDLSMQLHVEQPLKTPFLAAVILVANVKKQELAGEVLARLVTETEGAIQQGEWRTVKLHLKLLACLQSLLEDEGIFPLLDELFSRAADLQTASSEDTIGTEIVKIILLTIPYILVASPGQLSQQKAAELMEKTDIIASEPHALQAIVDSFHPETQEQNPGKSQSLCMLLQNQLQAEAAKDWELKCLPRPWQMPLEDIELQEKLSNPPKHALPTVNIPTAVIAGPRALFPEMYLSVYADQDAESVPPLTSISSSLIRDGLVDTINILNFNRNVVARYLLDIDSYFAEGTFVKRATAFDDLRNFPADRSTWKPEDVAVDTVFSQLFALPHPECKLVYYHSILTEACKLAPAAIAPSLGRAIRYLYRNNPRMDLELSYRFVDWFSHHLSNFGFTWKWAEWADDTSLPAMHPSIWFLEGALDKEIRLSFAQRIQKTVPDPYQALIGPEKEQDVPPFKFANPDVPFSKEGQEVGQLLRRKAADEEIGPIILSIQAQANSQNLDPYVTCTDVFMTAVCWVGSKSLSHVLACIDRTKARLLELSNASEASRMQVVTAVMSYWHAHPGVAISIIEKLLNYSVITPIAVINWALQGNDSTSGASGGEALAKAHVFEIVSNTVAKVTNRVRQLYASDEADDEVRAKEAQAMKDMFRTMNDTLTSWANGNKDQMIETGDGSSDREAMIRRWGQRWHRVFQRKAALEEAFLLEAAKGKDSMVVENGAGGQ